MGGAKRLSLLTSPLAKVGRIQSQRAVSLCVVAVSEEQDSSESIVHMYVCVSRC